MPKINKIETPVAKAAQTVQDAVTTAIRRIEAPRTSSVDSPKLKPQLETDVFTPKVVTEEAESMAKKPCSGHNVHSEKDVMPYHFGDVQDSSAPQRPGIDKWYEEITQEFEAKEAEKEAAKAKEALETRDYWQQHYWEKINEQEDAHVKIEKDIQEYFSNYFH